MSYVNFLVTVTSFCFVCSLWQNCVHSLFQCIQDSVGCFKLPYFYSILTSEYNFVASLKTSSLPLQSLCLWRNCIQVDIQQVFSSPVFLEVFLQKVSMNQKFSYAMQVKLSILRTYCHPTIIRPFIFMYSDHSQRLIQFTLYNPIKQYS